MYAVKRAGGQAVRRGLPPGESLPGNGQRRPAVAPETTSGYPGKGAGS